jgi:hypothetical protein
MLNRSTASVFGIALLTAGSLAAADWKLLGYGAVRGQKGDGRVSYLAGDWGKLDQPELGSADETETTGQFALGLDVEWRTGLRTLIHVGGRRDPVTVVDSLGRELDDPIGLIEAFVDYRRALSNTSELQTRAGFFFLPTSFENVDPLWTSPYTLTLSALNSWIGEEVRPVGVDLAWMRRSDGGGHFRLGATVFGGNDTMGTLVAWRGFALHDRLTPFDGEVPLHRSVFPAFPKQERSTVPFSADLDDEPGYSVRAELRGSSVAFRATHIDTRGDRDLHPQPLGQYAWSTQFTWLGGEVHAGLLTLASEWGQGSTAMGFRGRGVPWVDADFEVGYLLASLGKGPFRLSARFDTFEVTERDGGILDDNTEDGDATTVAAFWTFAEKLRVGVEAVDVQAERRRLPIRTIDNDQIKAEIRYRF